MHKFSVIIPVYNRPDEIEELVLSLCAQTLKPYEVLIIEDGSINKCDKVLEKYTDRLNIKYFYKENSGQGFSRNFGFEKATGDYFVVFDSDCIIPERYFEIVDDHISRHNLDAYGGPDKARSDFTSIQKAISNSMTSPIQSPQIFPIHSSL